jgi:hypothetical protein
MDHLGLQPVLSSLPELLPLSGSLLALISLTQSI